MPLFPVIECSPENQPHQPLPTVSSPQSEGGPKLEIVDLDWLHNDSYKPGSGSVEASHSYSTATEAYPTISPETSRNSDDCGPTFRSKIKQEEDCASGSPKEDEQRDVQETKYKRKHKKEKHKYKSKKHKHVKSSERSRSQSPSPQYSKTQGQGTKEFHHDSNKVFIEEIRGLEPEHAYRIDRRPNKNNYIYGSVATTHVPKFKRHVQVCLSEKDQPVVSLREQKVSRSHGDVRYYHKDNRKLIRSAPHAVLLNNVGGTDTGVNNFIPVGNTRTTSENQDGGLLKSDIREQLLDVKTRSYVQRVGIVPSQTQQKEDTIQTSYLWQKNADYNKRLRENPKDVKLWLEFVHFQDRYLYEDLSDESHSGSLNVKKLPRQVVHDKKVMILQKAMEANPSCVALKLRYLELCQSTLEPTDVNKELDALLFVYPTDVALWRRYLLYNQTHLSTFSVTRVCKLYSTCIRKLVGYQEGRVFSRGSTAGLDRDMLDLFVQYCCFLRQVGHTEKAVACFQALLELNLFCPPSLESFTHEDKQSVFESFWDSGVARVGEKNAKGWRYWKHHPGDLQTMVDSPPDTDIEKEEQEILARNDSKWRMWLSLEKLRQSAHWLPWRPDVSKDETEEDCQDMDRLVLFDDISGVLFTLPRWLHLEANLQFLIFLGVDNKCDFVTTTVNSLQGQCNIDRISQVLDHDELLPECHGQGEIAPLQKTYINTLFEQMTAYFENEKECQSILTVMRLRFFKQCIGRSSNGLKHLKKFGKSLLKEPQNRVNLFVWSEYAFLLWIVGGATEAQPVVEAALSIHSGPGLYSDTAAHTKCGLTRLHRILAEIVMSFPPGDLSVLGDRIQLASRDELIKQAQWGLQCLVQEKNIKDPQTVVSSPLMFSSVRRKMEVIFNGFTENLKNQLCVRNDKSMLMLQLFCEFTRCYVLYVWLTAGRDSLGDCVALVDRALTLVRRHLAAPGALVPDDPSPLSSGPDNRPADIARDEPMTSNCCRVLEELHRIKVRIIAYHMSVLSAPLSRLRAALTDALSDFPCHSYFLWMFTETELRTNLSGRLNQFFSHRLKAQPDPIPLLVAILSQIKRLRNLENHLSVEGACKTGDNGQLVIPETSMIHRIRTYLDMGKESLHTQNCPLLWRVGLYTEMKYGKKERAMGLFYQALQHCPWAKVLYMDGVALFGEDKLEDITDLLMEKELRLQMPLEEMDILLA